MKKMGKFGNGGMVDWSNVVNVNPRKANTFSNRHTLLTEDRSMMVIENTTLSN